MINIILNIAAIVIYLLITYFVINAIKTHKMLRDHIRKQQEMIRKEIDLLDIQMRRQLEEVDLSNQSKN